MAKRNAPPGPAVDASGQSVVDPSENVKALSRADSRRQDDIRTLTTKFLQREMRAELKSVRREMKLRAQFADKFNDKEAQRLDSIRTVDVAAVQRAAEVAAEAVAALATQVPITAQAVRDALATALDPITNNIAELQRAQYELQGQRVGVADKTDSAAELAQALKPMVDSIAKLSEERSERQGGEAQVVQQRAQFSQTQVTVGIVLAAAAAVAGYLIK